MKYSVTKNKIKDLYESSVNRLKYWVDNYDVATITAFRNQLINVVDEKRTKMEYYKIGHKFTLAENRKRNNELYKLLLGYGFGVTKINGSYIEKTDNASKEVTEESFFVVNKNNNPEFFNILFKLSEWFNQDSFLFKSVNDNNAYLVGTNACGFPEYGEKIIQGNMRFIAGRYMSRIKNAAFTFANNETPSVNNPDELPDNYDQYLIKNKKTSAAIRKAQRVTEWINICDNNGIDFPKFNISEKKALALEFVKLNEQMNYK